MKDAKAITVREIETVNPVREFEVMNAASRAEALKAKGVPKLHQRYSKTFPSWRVERRDIEQVSPNGPYFVTVRYSRGKN